MSSQEDFDRIIRDKLAQKALPVDEENWENIRALRDADREKRKRRRWAIVYFFGLLTGMGLMLPFMHFSGDKEQKAEQLTSSKEEKKELVETKQAAKKENRTKRSDEAPAEHGSGVISTEKEEIHIGDDNVRVSKEEVKRAPKEDGGMGVSMRTDQKKQSPKEGGAVSVRAGERKSLSKANSRYSVGTGEKKQASKEADSERMRTEEKSSRSVAANPGSDEISKEKELAADQQKTGTPGTEITFPLKTIPDEAPKKEPETSHNQTGKNSGDSAVQKTTGMQLTQPDTSAPKNVAYNPAKSTNSLPDNTKELRKSNWWIEAGAGYSLGWNYTDTSEGRGVAPAIGIGFSQELNDRWFVHTGLQGTALGNLTASDHVIRHVNCGFGYSASDSVISTRWLYYLTVPLQIEYRLNDKNYLGAGGSLSWLITGSGTITTYTQTDEFGTSSKYQHAQTGYVNGFNTWNASVMVMYRRKLSERLYASLIPYYGLMDIKNNNFFGKTNFERDSGIRLMLLFSLFK